MLTDSTATLDMTSIITSRWKLSRKTIENTTHLWWFRVEFLENGSSKYHEILQAIGPTNVPEIMSLDASC